MNIQQIEADVVIVLESDAGDVKTIPYWECQIPANELRQMLPQMILAFNEELGCGTVTGYIRDFRPNQA